MLRTQRPTQNPRRPRAQTETPTLTEQEETAASLMSKLRTIEGGRVMIHFTTEQWHLTEQRALDRCHKFICPARNSEEALEQTKLLSGCIAVTAHEVACHIDAVGAFRIRSHRVSAGRKSRPTAVERSAATLAGHVRQLKRSLRYTHGRGARNELKAKIKEAGKLHKTYLEESSLQRLEMAQR